MSYNRAAFLGPMDKVLKMRLKLLEDFGTIDTFWWKLVPGVEIEVKWPRGEIVIDESMPQWDWTVGPSKYIVESADPNDHYRPELERLVGIQKWDWDWKVNPNNLDILTIKFRKGKAKYASYFALKWT